MTRDGEVAWETVTHKRRAPHHAGGFEYRVVAPGRAAEWVAVSALTAGQRAALAPTVASAPLQASSMHEYVRGEGEDEHGERRAERTRARRACVDGGGADEADMQAAWCMFCRYASSVRAHDGEVEQHNARDQTARAGRRGRTWVCEAWRTVYLGGREEDPDETEVEKAMRRQARPGAMEGRACMSLEVDETCPGDVPMAWRVTDDAIRRAMHAENDKVTLDVLDGLMRDEWQWGEHERKRETSELRRALKGQGLYAGGMPKSKPFGQRPIMSGERTPAGTEELMWKTGGGPSGMTEVTNEEINNDPALRVFQRCDSVEQAPGVTCSDGRRVVLDADERKVMAESGRLQTWMARWVVTSLHVAHHLTDVAACDASKKVVGGEERSAIGIWEGVQTGGGGEERCIANGMIGAAVPGRWDITTSEMYAILHYLRIVRRRQVRMGARRCLVMSDCRNALIQIERAWRRGRAVAVRGEARGAMLEEICNIREEMAREGGRVILVWVPGHRGVAPNAYADAIAKAYLHDEVGDVMAPTVRCVETTPCLYEVWHGHEVTAHGGAGREEHTEGGGVDLCHEQVYRDVRSAARAYTCQRLRTHTRGELLLGMRVDEVWSDVMCGVVTHALGRRTGRGKGNTQGAEVAAEGDGERDEEGVQHRESACGLCTAAGSRGRGERSAPSGDEGDDSDSDDEAWMGEGDGRETP